MTHQTPTDGRRDTEQTRNGADFTPDVESLYRRLDRAHALADVWDGDPAPITRAEAAELLYSVLSDEGWTLTEPDQPALALVPSTNTEEQP